jgi:energy-coupling factor transport system permease protein
LLWLTALLILSFAASSTAQLAFIIAAILISSFVAELDLRSYLPMAKLVAALAVALAIIQSLFRHDEIVYGLGPVALHPAGFWLALHVSARLFCVILASLQLLMWTHPTDLTLVLVKAKLPYRYAMLIGLSFRFFPLMEQELQSIFDAQAARGLELRGALRKGLAFGPVMLPLFLRALRRASEVALAMEVRAYGLRRQRTFVRTLRLRAADQVLIGMITLCTATLLTTRRW